MEDNSNSSRASTFPSIGSLFNETWQTFTQSVLSLFILNVLGIAIYIGLAVIAVLFFVLSGAGSFLLKNGLQEIATTLPSISGSTITILVVIAVVFGFIYLIVGSALQIASILLVDSQGKTPLGSAFKKSLGLVIPLFLVNILTSILSFGAFFVFILPAILFYFLLIFAQFEVMLNNQRWLGAIRRSVMVVSKNFGAILVRLILLILIYLAYAIVTNLISKIGPDVQIFVAIISFLINLLLGWFALAYLITLYKQARGGLENQPGKGIVWMWIVAIIGWLIAAGVFFMVYKAASSGAFNELLKKSQTTTQTQQAISPTVQLIQSGSLKLSTANQLTSKPDLTDDERNQIIGLVNGALNDFNAAVEKDPNNYQAWYYRGVAYRNLIGVAQNADRFAIDSFDKAISINSNDYNAYLQRGGLYYQNKQYEKAIEDFQKVTELEPNLANGYFNLGVAYKQAGAKDSARKALEKTLELLPKDDPTRYKAESELNSL